MKTKDRQKRVTFNFRNIFFLFLAFMFGIMVARKLYSGSTEMIILSVCFLFAMVMLMVINKKFMLFTLMICLFFVGNGWFYLGQKSFDVPTFQENVKVSGRVSDNIVKGNYSYTVTLDDVKIDGKPSKNVRIYISNCTKEPKIGDYATFITTLSSSKAFVLDEFNSSDYRSGVRYSGYVKSYDIVYSEGYIKFDERVRTAVKDVLENHLSEKNASLAFAVLFGDKSGVDANTKEAYRNTNVIHLLTVSGLHVGFLMTLFFTFLKKCKVNKYACAMITTFILIFYAYLCSFTPTVMRAGIMMIVYMCAKTFNKRYDSLNSLGFASFIICLLMPLTPHDLGFQLSFFSVFAIVTLFSLFYRFFRKFLPDKIAQLASISFAAQAGIVPFLAKMKSSVHLLSFMLNMIVVPIFSVLYPYLFLVSMLGTFMPFLGYLLYPANIAFNVINSIVAFFDNTGLTMPLPPEYFGVTVLFFILIYLASGLLMTKTLKKLAIFSSSLILTCFALGIYSLPKKNYISVNCLSSGSDYCLVLSNSLGEKVLVGADYNVLRYSRNFDVDSYDAVILFNDDLTDRQLGYISQLDYGNIFCNENMLDYDRITTLPLNMSIKQGAFSFSYISNEDKFIGIFIESQGSRIFIAQKEQDDYNLINKTLLQLSPQIVYANGNQIEGDFIKVDLENRGDNYSYEEYGNFELFQGGSNWNLRRLD